MEDIRFPYQTSVNPKIIGLTSKIRNQLEEVTGDPLPSELSEEDALRINFGDEICHGVLTFYTLKQLLSENLIRFPIITEDEINDKSKGDALSKGIALLQLT